MKTEAEGLSLSSPGNWAVSHSGGNTSTPSQRQEYCCPPHEVVTGRVCLKAGVWSCPILTGRAHHFLGKGAVALPMRPRRPRARLHLSLWVNLPISLESPRLVLTKNLELNLELELLILTETISASILYHSQQSSRRINTVVSYRIHKPSKLQSTWIHPTRWREWVDEVISWTGRYCPGFSVGFCRFLGGLLYSSCLLFSMRSSHLGNILVPSVEGIWDYTFLKAQNNLERWINLDMSFA